MGFFYEILRIFLSNTIIKKNSPHLVHSSHSVTSVAFKKASEFSSGFLGSEWMFFNSFPEYPRVWSLISVTWFNNRPDELFYIILLFFCRNINIEDKEFRANINLYSSFMCKACWTELTFTIYQIFTTIIRKSLTKWFFPSTLLCE